MHMANMKSFSIPLTIIIIIISFLIEQSTVYCLAKNNITFDCVPKEKKALLRFKASLSDPSDRLSSWKTEYNCCTWAGVECDKAAGHVIELHLGNRVIEEDDVILEIYQSLLNTLRSEMVDSSLMELKYLHYLDLSLNDFQESSIPASLGSMKHLQHLNLSNSNFSGIVPHQLSNLSSLRTLDLGSSIFGTLHNSLIVNDLTWANNLSSLEYLDMSQVDLSRTKDVVKELGTLPSLLELRMSGSGLDNTILSHTYCFNSTLFTNVQHLDLSYNYIEGEFPCFLHNMTSLNYLDLSVNQYNPSARQPFPILMNLSYLDLSYNSLNHSATWIFDVLLNKYCRFKSLYLKGNLFHGDISGVFKNISKCSSHNLESLDLSLNEFHGHFPEELGELRQLKVFRVSGNQLSGEIPIGLGQLSNLEKIDISHNAFEGTLSDAHFVRLSKLVQFDASYNYMLKFRVSYNWVPPCQLKYLYLGSVQIGGQIPDGLQTQKGLTDLVLSNCSITGTLPKWLSSFMNLTRLDLSNNQIEGPIPELAPSMTRLDLSNNQIEGPIPDLASTMTRLDLSDNMLMNGSIPDSLCQMKSLETLDLSKNRLSGNLPDCWGNFEILYTLSLSSNQFSGDIPNSIGEAYNLELLQLNNNSFTGQLPTTLTNCTGLTILDVGDNKLSGKLPELDIMSQYPDRIDGLTFLRLRNNEFYGNIPSSYCQLYHLQILDLAQNNLTGNIPHCLGNFSGMVKGGMYDLDLDVSLSEVMKGVMMEYTNTSTYTVNLDLSSNNLVGEIPPNLTNLTGLIGLNLSHNHLRGRIPRKIGDMESLESLDLSSNNLSGTIPESLSKLTFLSHLNLSHNNLSGPIPTGPQLQTLNESSNYEGNSGLCGAPLLKKCHTDNETPPKVEHDTKDDDGEISYKIYLIASIISGVATGFWGYVGVLVFKRSWRLALFKRMDMLIGKILG
ncbi:hypothetical protein CASFOL_020337 [Castilleja foliolosa]|uniref:Leucine-rich repeat-containing N-terminal plant-type domain-containing protein n=1 Tax=Castilleja foliolosa TaxID=1961234 RepID=A0ABD3D0K0_9LAMI